MIKDVNRLNWLRSNLYYFSALLMVASMPLSKAMLSVSLVVMCLAWLVAPGFNQRLQNLKTKKSIWFFTFGFWLVVAGMFYSENLARNFSLVFNIKISLLLLPVIMGSFPPFSKKQLLRLLIVFTIANITATLVSTSILLHFINYNIADTREISIFISSVRFSLLVALNVLLLGYTYLKTYNFKQKVAIAVTIIWLVIFLFLLQTLTGIMVLAGTLLVLLFVNIKKLKPAVLLFIVVVAGVAVIWLVYFVKEVTADYYAIHESETINERELSLNGNPYTHVISDTTRINGYLVWRYVCEPELREEWQKRSSWPFDSLDLRKWWPVKRTLVYYMASKGLRKDSAGMAQLSERDIRNIENGYNNAALATVGLYGRVYDIVREIDVWQKTGKPAGSITIRINALQNGWKVFVRSPWLGTGYGDINDDIQAQYEADKMVFGKDKRQNPHNQLFTILIGAGVLGLAIFIFSFIAPAIIEKRFRSTLFLMAFCVVSLSFFTDDTLERMVGAIITAFSFSLFLYGISKNDEED